MLKKILFTTFIFAMSTVQAEVVVDLGFDGSLSNSASGVDAIKKGNDSDVVYVSDRFGNANSAMYFGDKSLVLGDTFSGDSLVEYTVSSWIKMDDYDGGVTKRNYLFDARTNLDRYSPAMMIDDYVENQKNNLLLYSRNLEKGKVDFESFSWVHVAATFNTVTNVSKVYINGELEIESIGVVALDLAALSIGDYYGYVNGTDERYRFDGAMDDFRIYDEAISDSEVKALFEAGESSVKDVPAPFGVALLSTLFFVMRRKK